MTQLETVRHIYDAFRRQDVPAILGVLAEDVEWEYGVTSTDVPWLQPRRGRARVAEFFAALGGMDLRTFQPKTFLEQGNIVVVLIDTELTVKATGRTVIETDEVHIWHFDGAGQVSRFRHQVDTHQHQLAWTGDAARAERVAG